MLQEKLKFRSETANLNFHGCIKLTQGGRTTVCLKQEAWIKRLPLISIMLGNANPYLLPVLLQLRKVTQQHVELGAVRRFVSMLCFVTGSDAI